MSTTVKPNLADRYARLTDPTAGLSMEQLQAMSVQELGDFQVDFGRAMKGRKYLDVVENESDWVKWMLSHMTGSEKRCHRIFFLFLEKYTAEAETIEGALRGGDPPSDRDLDEPAARNTKVRPKSKAAPRNAVTASSSSGLDQWDVIAETSDAAPPLDNQVTAMATRLTQLEHVMEQVLVALQQITPPPAPQ